MHNYELKNKVMQSNDQEIGCLLGVTLFNILMRLKQPTNNSTKPKPDKLGFSSRISFFVTKSQFKTYDKRFNIYYICIKRRRYL